VGPRESGAASPAARGSRPSSVLSSGRVAGDVADHIPGTPIRSADVQTISIATQTHFTDEGSGTPPAQKHETISYSIGIQTTESWSPPRHYRAATNGLSDSDNDHSPSAIRTPKASKRLSRREKDREDDLRRNLRREVEEELKAVKHPTSGSFTSQGTQLNFPIRGLTGDELNAVTSSEDFLDFVERSSKVIERALDQEYDVLADYALDGLNGVDDDDDEGYANSHGKRRRLKEVAQFYDERWSKKRMISDINFSPKVWRSTSLRLISSLAQFPELLLASYTKNPSAPQDPSGLVQIWNLHLHSRPEYTFHSTSDILTAKFSPFHPSIIVGGSYSGQVLLWDTRARSALPVQKTPLTGASSGGHTHPVYSIDIVGTQNANNIISCSTDGVVCGWTVDMLSQPQEYLELTAPPPNKTEDLSPTCMAFPPSDPTSFLVGSEEGTIYPCHRYDRAGAKAGVDARIRYRGHAAPVMSLDFHPARGPVDLSDLVLTSSMDWTVKLWRIRASSSTAASAAAPSSATFVSALPGAGATNTQEIYPVMEFAREDVVYDARWSPSRPGAFALVDGAGSVEIWDLMDETEVPIAKASPSANKKIVGLAGSYVPKGLNKVSWEEKDGKKLAVGGAGGLVTVFEMVSGIGGEGPKAEDWAGVKRLVSRMEKTIR
jgi:dynein intermediate chain